MKTYLSYGGGVNSTAMLLLLHDEGLAFESIYVDHGCDWPETREYVQMIADKFPITILTPKVEKFSSLYQYCEYKKIIPSRRFKWCSHKFKRLVTESYIEKPCFMLLGYDADEPQRAILSSTGGIENRFPLIEREMTRLDCIKTITSHGLTVPIKSGCWFCPWQKKPEWEKLRRIHPDLFCMAEKLENNMNENRRLPKGKKPIFLSQNMPLKQRVNEKQSALFAEMEYPPCHCGL